MSEIHEIAYAAATNRLCLFTGTGFSKEVCKTTAPSWQGLLEELCKSLPDSDKLINSLFPSDKPSALTLEEVAQIISIHMAVDDKSIHIETAKIIDKIEISEDVSDIKDFFESQSFRVVTTNYDKLAEALVGDNTVQSITPGLPIPRSSANVKVYHVHGSTDSPQNMVITSEDYFKFLSKDSYFSRKLSTVLHENTVVILGYSLGDTNLKAIISDYNGFSKSHVVGSNIFLVSRRAVDPNIKDYYFHCYGIRVLDSMDIKSFFGKLNKTIPIAKETLDKSVKALQKVIYEGRKFKSTFLKIEDSFYRIIAGVGALGLSWNDELVVEMIGGVIEQKTRLTGENGAWVQYEHLARWLIYLGTIIDLKGTSIEDKYLEAVLHSMNTMRKELYFGYSWHAYKSWKERWPAIIVSNRTIIKKYITKKTTWPDAIALVNGL